MAKVNIKKIQEQSDEGTVNIGRTVPVKIKKEGGKFCIYRIEQPSGDETKTLNRSFDSKEDAERAAKLRGFTIVNDKYEVQDYDIDKRPSKLKTTKEKVEYVTEIVRRILKESKVSKKKRLVEAKVSPEIQKKLDELGDLQAKLQEAQAQIKAIVDKMESELDVKAMKKRETDLIKGELWDFFEQMKHDNDRIAQTKKYVMEIMTYQAEVETFKYEEAFDFLMTQVNQDVKYKVLEFLKDKKKISKRVGSLLFKPNESVILEDNWLSNLWSSIKSIVSSSLTKIRSKDQSLDKNISMLAKLAKTVKGQ